MEYFAEQSVFVLFYCVSCIFVACLRVQGKAVNTPVQNTKEITIKNGYEKNPFIVFGICLVRSNSKSNKEVTSEEHSTKSKI